MPQRAKIPTAMEAAPQRFAARLALFYGAIFGVSGAYLPFFSVWLKAVGIDPAWIGLIVAAPSVTRFTTLPFVIGLAERHRVLKSAMVASAFLTVGGFAIVGMLHQPLAVFLVFALTSIVWTPVFPLADGYALKGVMRFGLDYGPVRLWGSAAFAAGALICGLLVEFMAADRLIWIIVGTAALGMLTSFGLISLDTAAHRVLPIKSASGLLRDRGFLTIMVSAALIQSSHAAYYTVASINWQASGLGTLTIAVLWTLGVAAEIVVFALSPRFTLSPATLVVMGGASALLRWTVTAQEPVFAVLVVVQLMHGLTYGLTQVGTMGLLIRHVPSPIAASAQGYLTACTGIVTSAAAVLSGAIYARYGQGVYYPMAGLGLAGATVMWLGRHRADQPQSVAAGG